jgi:hypothetical protein
MKVATMSILFAASLVMTGGAFAQGMNGGAAEAKGVTGTSNSDGERSTNAAPGASGVNRTGAGTNSTPKNGHKKSGTGTSAPAANRGSGGS